MNLRASTSAFLDRPAVGQFIFGVIVFNAIILGLETSESMMAQAGGLILLLDQICLAIFVAELAVKLFAYGPRFFRGGWNIFDFIIVGISLVPGNGAL